MYILVSFADDTDTYLLKLELDSTKRDFKKPLIDNRVELSEPEYDSESNYTRYSVVGAFPCLDTVLIRMPHEEHGTELTAVVSTLEVVDEDGGGETWYTHIDVEGDTRDLPLISGTKFKTTVSLSEQFVRDDKNNVRNGVLNLRSMSLRHANSGAYDIVVSRRGREAQSFHYNPYYVGTTGSSPFPFETIEEDGEFLVRIFGLSTELDVSIESDYPSPFNITNIEFRGKFSSRDSLLERR